MPPLATPARHFAIARNIQAPTRRSPPRPVVPKPPPPELLPDRWWLTNLIGGVLLALAVAFAGLYPRASETPEDSVLGYLQALARGDAAAALGFAAEPPADLTFLTDDVLRASQARSPLTDIVVHPTPGCTRNVTCQVVATFDLGGHAISAPYSVVYSAGQYRLVDVARQVDLGALAGGRLTIEGRPTPGSSVGLFPGVYRVGSANPLLAVDITSYTVPSPGDTAMLAVPGFALTPDSAGRLQTVAADALERCLAERALFTSCGFGWAKLSGDATPDTSRLQWKYHAGAANTLPQAEFALVQDAPATVAAPISITLDIDVYDTAGVHYIDSMTLNQVRVDFDDPQAPAVTMKGVTWGSS